MNDIGVLLNLACLKYTGCYLPSNAEAVKEWSYETDEFGIRRGKFNPFADTLLTNPFRTAYDSYPIEHKIKRQLITDEIKEIAAKPITAGNILKVMCGKKIDLGFTESERYALIKARNNFIRFAEFVDTDGYNSKYDIINEKKYKELDNDERHGWTTWFRCALAMNPDLATITEKYAADKLNKRKKKYREIRKAYKPVGSGSPEKIYSDKHEGVIGFEYGDYGLHRKPQRIKDITTDALFPVVGKKHQSPWFWYWVKNNTGREATYYRNELKRVNNKRSTNKFNWWEYIKKESGWYIPEDKTNHEKRVLTAIMNI
mgnify:FL=1